MERILGIVGKILPESIVFSLSTGSGLFSVSLRAPENHTPAVHFVRYGIEGEPLNFGDQDLSERYIVAFSGTIYDIDSISKDLDLRAFSLSKHGYENILALAIHRWGLLSTLKRISGPFALAYWDNDRKLLQLARDRLGKQPLYYAWMDGALLFASELRVFRNYPGFRPTINRDALALFLRHNYIPTPYTIYNGIYKVRPGTILKVDFSKKTIREETEVYWSVKDIAENGRHLNIEFEDAVGEVHKLVKAAVNLRMPADPIGTFLSGGVDSALITAVAQSMSGSPVKTFTIGFYEQAFDEAVHAKELAAHLGTQHTELYVTPKDAAEVIVQLPAIYEEPFADSSQIATYLVARLAGAQVERVLSGDGGDEFFAGYNRHVWGKGIWNRSKRFPQTVRSLIARMMLSISPSSWDRCFAIIGKGLPRRFRVRHPGSKIHKLAGILDVTSPEELYLRLTSHWMNPESVVLGASEPLTSITDLRQWAQVDDFTDRMMYLDAKTYLSDDILVKVGRAASSTGILVCSPFLDHRIIEYAWKLPLSLHLYGGEGKAILKEILRKYVPAEMMDRPKSGFGVPIDKWLRGPLREWAEDLLNEHRLEQEGFFNPAPIRNKWKEHLSGRRDWHHHLWDVLMFQAWYSAVHKGN